MKSMQATVGAAPRNAGETPHSVTERRGERSRPSRRKRGGMAGWSFVAFYAVLLLVFGVGPVVFGVYTAFVVTPVVGPSYFSLTENFTAVVADFRTPQAALNVLTYLAIWLPIMLIIVFALALVMDSRRTRFAALTRFVSYVPGAVTGAAAALLWLFMFSPRLSPFSALLRPFAAENGSLVSDQTLPVILAVMGVAAGAGGWIVLLYGALTAIPAELIEAAKIDGANAWHLAWHVKLPMIRSYIAFILIVSFAAGFQVFVEPQVIATGAPGQVSTSWSLNQMVFQFAAGQANYGRASALSVLLLIVTVAIAVFVITRTRFYSIGGSK